MTQERLESWAFDGGSIRADGDLGGGNCKRVAQICPDILDTYMAHSELKNTNPIVSGSWRFNSDGCWPL